MVDAGNWFNMRMRLGQQKKIDGWVTVDKYGNPDIKQDLDKYPWKIKDSSVNYLIALDVINHTKDFQRSIEEIYRICENDALVHISVPWWRTDRFKHIWHYWTLKPSALKELDYRYVEKSESFRNGDMPFKLKLINIYNEKRFLFFECETHAIFKVIK